MASGLILNRPSLIASLIASTRALSITGTFSMAWSCDESEVIWTLSCAAGFFVGGAATAAPAPCFEPRVAVSFTPVLAGDFTEVSIFKVNPFGYGSFFDGVITDASMIYLWLSDLW